MYKESACFFLRKEGANYFSGPMYTQRAVLYTSVRKLLLRRSGNICGLVGEERRREGVGCWGYEQVEKKEETE